MALVNQLSEREQLIKECRDRIRDVESKGNRPTILLVLQCLEFLLRKKRNGGVGDYSEVKQIKEEVF